MVSSFKDHDRDERNQESYTDITGQPILMLADNYDSQQQTNTPNDQAYTNPTDLRDFTLPQQSLPPPDIPSTHNAVPSASLFNENQVWIPNTRQASEAGPSYFPFYSGSRVYTPPPPPTTARAFNDIEETKYQDPNLNPITRSYNMYHHQYSGFPPTAHVPPVPPVPPTAIPPPPPPPPPPYQGSRLFHPISQYDWSMDPWQSRGGGGLNDGWSKARLQEQNYYMSPPTMEITSPTVLTRKFSHETKNMGFIPSASRKKSRISKQNSIVPNKRLCGMGNVRTYLDSNNIPYLEFDYPQNGKKHTIRIDIENIDLNSLDDGFKLKNRIYYNALHPETYKGRRFRYENECNEIGWKLAYLNPFLEEEKGVRQRAVDCYRNKHEKFQSRRAKKMAKRDQKLHCNDEIHDLI